MVSSALLLLALVAQQPTQQPAAAPAKPRVNAAQQADTSKAKRHRRHAHKAKSTGASSTAAPRDTTKHS